VTVNFVRREEREMSKTSEKHSGFNSMEKLWKEVEEETIHSDDATLCKHEREYLVSDGNYQQVKQKSYDDDLNNKQHTKKYTNKVNEALKQVNESRLEIFMNMSEENPHTFSAEYLAHKQQLMKKLEKRKHKKGIFHKTTNHAIKYTRIAAVILLFFVSIRLTTLNADALPAPIENFLIKVGNNFTNTIVYEEIYAEDIESFDKIKRIYEPEITIDGYKKINEEKNTFYVEIFYQNKDAKQYKFMQMTEDAWNTFDISKAQVEEIPLEIEKGYWKNEEGNGWLYWSDKGYIFCLNGEQNIEDFIAIANSLTLQD